MCPEAQLLVFDLLQGWKPLCDFLEKPILHVNDKKCSPVVCQGSHNNCDTGRYPCLINGPYVVRTWFGTSIRTSDC